VQDAEFWSGLGPALGEHDDDAKDNGGGRPTTRCDEHGLGGGFKCVSRAVILFQRCLARSKPLDIKSPLQPPAVCRKWFRSVLQIRNAFGWRSSVPDPVGIDGQW